MAKRNDSYKLIDTLLSGVEVVEKTPQSDHSNDNQEQSLSLTNESKNTDELRAQPNPLADLLMQCTQKNKKTTKLSGH